MRQICLLLVLTSFRKFCLRFDVTVTSALMETVKMTSSTWKKDYASVTEMKTMSLARKRLPLVAYVLRNLTGSPLRFATQTAAMHEGSEFEEGINFFYY